MALSEELKSRLEVAISDKKTADELIAAIQASVASPAADVAANSPAGAVTVTTSGGNTYADSAINTALASVVSDINADRTQINAILSSLKAAGLMS